MPAADTEYLNNPPTISVFLFFSMKASHHSAQYTRRVLREITCSVTITIPQAAHTASVSVFSALSIVKILK
jgi:hypothetical protein